MEIQSNEPIEAPHVDPKSSRGHLIVARRYLEQRFGKTKSWILRANYVGESASRNYYWFRDTPEVRAELGMEATRQL